MKVRNIVAGALAGVILVAARGCSLNKDYRNYSNASMSDSAISRPLTEDEIYAQGLRNDFFGKYDVLKDLKDYSDYVDVSSIADSLRDNSIRRFDNDAFKRIINASIQSDSQFQSHLKTNDPSLNKLISHSKDNNGSYYSFNVDDGDTNYFMMISANDYHNKLSTTKYKRFFGDRVAIEVNRDNGSLIRDHSVVNYKGDGKIKMDVSERQVLHSSFDGPIDKPYTVVTIENGYRLIKGKDGKYSLDSRDATLEINYNQIDHYIGVKDEETLNHLYDEIIKSLDSEYPLDTFLSNNKELIFSLTDNEYIHEFYDNFYDYYKVKEKQKSK